MGGSGANVPDGMAVIAIAWSASTGAVGLWVTVATGVSVLSDDEFQRLVLRLDPHRGAGGAGRSRGGAAQYGRAGEPHLVHPFGAPVGLDADGRNIGPPPCGSSGLSGD